MHKKSIYISFIPFGVTVFFVFIILLSPFTAAAQCSTTVNSFPYSEDFETSDGNWVTGGTSSDWAWGVPSKPVIAAAAHGIKCWLTGGLNKPGYNDGENAWLKSPCFNFSGLLHPYISFNVFWETEGKYDGANLQYSTDNGSTWKILGSKNETVSCLNTNWYNSTQLQYLQNSDGWSGNIQPNTGNCIGGGGSRQWMAARHDLSFLAGSPSVQFRFVFASGTQCNNYDGFAIDYINVNEGDANSASFSFLCINNLVTFSAAYTNCPSAYEWNFGDPGSADNTSTLPRPQHDFKSGGSYGISLKVYWPDGSSYEYTSTVNIIVLTAQVINDNTCGTADGAARAILTGGGTSFTYYWDTDPPQNTDTATGLASGTYLVSVTPENGCAASSFVIINGPALFSYSATDKPASCTKNDGSISLQVSGGTAPYTYSWSPNVSSTSTASNLYAGNYKITVTDKNNCNYTINYTLANAAGPVAATQVKNTNCFGSTDGIATVTASGGTAPYTYSWSPSGGNAAVANNLAAGNYTATVTDNNGCTTTAAATINQPAALITSVSSQNTSCGNKDGSALVQVTGGISPYRFTWGPGNLSGASVTNLDSGQYIVTVEDTNGCMQNDTTFIASSTAVKLQLSHKDVDCFGNITGNAAVEISGGTSPYNISWASGTQTYTGNSLKNAGAGTFTITVHDADICAATGSVIITQPTPFNLLVNTQPSVCSQNNGTATVTVSGATPPYSYLWLTLTDTTPAVTNLSPGLYQMSVTDKNNCVVTTGAQIENINPLQISLGSDTTICEGDKIILSPGNFSSYTWQDYSKTPAYTVLQQGSYSVTVTDTLGCTASDTIKIVADCGEIFFPSAFTPNNDSRNDYFGPLGNLNAVKDYSLVVYNRWGQLVFQSSDPFKKWDGKVQANNPQAASTFVWIAKFTYKTQTNIVRKGTVTIVY